MHDDLTRITSEIYNDSVLDNKQIIGKGRRNKRPKTIRLKTLISLIFSVFLIMAAIFGFLYYKAKLGLLGNNPADLTTPPKFLYSIYEGKNKFARPMAVAVNKNGDIYVTNNSMHTVEVISSNGKPLFYFGGPGNGNGQLYYPYGIGILPDGNILVSETGNGRVQEFSPKGKYIRTFFSRFDKAGLEKPGPLYIDSKGMVYLGDVSQNKVYILDSDGNLLKTIDNIKYPHGISVDELSRKLYVSDAGEVGVKMFFLQQNNNVPTQTINCWKPDSRFSMVRGLGLDSLGRLYVCDTINSSIRVFDKNGEYLFSFGQKGLKDGDFVYPIGISVDKKGKIYVTDWGNNRVEVWGY